MGHNWLNSTAENDSDHKANMSAINCSWKEGKCLRYNTLPLQQTHVWKDFNWNSLSTFVVLWPSLGHPLLKDLAKNHRNK